MFISYFNKVPSILQETLSEVKNNLSLLTIANFVMHLPQHAEHYPGLFENASKIKGIEDFITNETLMQEMIKLLGDHFPGAVCAVKFDWIFLQLRASSCSLVDFTLYFLCLQTKALLHDRNELMTQRLRSIEGRIVAVVGLGHVQGIQELWQNEEL
jgi:hypothetical protein